jgi:hypothetical protein
MLIKMLNFSEDFLAKQPHELPETGELIGDQPADHVRIKGHS